jgi:hypothetical protein
MNMSVRCVRHYILSCMHWSTTLHPALQALEHCIITALSLHYILPCRHWSTALKHCITSCTTLHPVLQALEHYIITTFCLAGIGALHWSTALEHCITSCTTLHPVLQALEHYITSCLAGIGALHYHYIITTFCLAGIGALHWSTALHPALHYILSYRHWSWICAWRVEHGNLRRDPPGRQAGKGFTAYVVSHVSFLTHVCLQGPERIPIKLLLHHMLIVIALPASLCF